MLRPCAEAAEWGIHRNEGLHYWDNRDDRYDWASLMRCIFLANLCVKVIINYFSNSIKLRFGDGIYILHHNNNHANVFPVSYIEAENSFRPSAQRVNRVHVALVSHCGSSI